MKRHLVHVVHRQISQRRRRRYRIRALLRIVLTHRGRAVQKYLHLHLPLVGKQLQIMLLEARVQIPVDSSDVVPKLILSVIRKLHRLSVGVYQMLTSEISRKAAP